MSLFLPTVTEPATLAYHGPGTDSSISSWTRNTDLDDLDFDAVADLVTPKMRKDLAAAHQLAAEQNSIDDYKRVLTEFQEAKLAEQEAKAARARAKKEKATKKSEPKIEDDDVDMPDASAQESEGSEKKKATKKRKAEEENAVSIPSAKALLRKNCTDPEQQPPQRSDSVKKPKIKLTSSSTPKAATNGASEPKESAAKPPKAKSSKSKPAKDADGEKPKKSPAPKEPELTPEEKQDRKKVRHHETIVSKTKALTFHAERDPLPAPPPPEGSHSSRGPDQGVGYAEHVRFPC